MVKISVVVPVYGVEKYIDQLLDSIRRQQMQDIEVIFVDDGSPDRCPEILDAFAAEDSRYTVIHQKNGGVSAARNAGLAQATGEYVYIIDSDDWLEEGALENLWAEAQRTGADVIYGDWIIERNSGAKRMLPFTKPFVTEDPETIQVLQCALNSNSQKMTVSRPEFEAVHYLGGAPWRALIRRAVIADNNVAFDPYVKGLGDDILFMLHVYEFVHKVAYVQVPIYHYRIVDASYSHGFKAKLLDNYKLIFARMEQFLREAKKDEKHWQAYYFRVLIYFQQAMGRYFKNPNNPATEKERYVAMKELLATEPYRTAVDKVPLHIIGHKKTKITLMLLRLRMYKLYWMLKK